MYRLLGENKKIIPCDDGECRGIDNIIFTKESEERYKKIINLFGKAKVAGYFDADEDVDAGVFTIVKRYYGYYEKNYEFYNFIKKNEINLLSVENLLEKLTAVDYESLDSKTFASFTELLVKKIILEYIVFSTTMLILENIHYYVCMIILISFQTNVTIYT